MMRKSINELIDLLPALLLLSLVICGWVLLVSQRHVLKEQMHTLKEWNVCFFTAPIGYKYECIP